MRSAATRTAAAGLLEALERGARCRLPGRRRDARRRPLLRVARPARGRGGATADGRRDGARSDLPPGGEADAADVRGSRRGSGGRRALHASRIAVKRARYAADLAAHELGRPGERFVAIAKQLQDILGDHQDAVVAQARIRAWADSSAGLRAGSPRGGSSSSSAIGWSPPVPPGPRPGAARRGGAAGRSLTRVVRAAGGIVVRADGADDPGAARPPTGVRRLDVPEREGRTGRERRGVRRPRGRGGDRPRLLARTRAALDRVRRREGAARRTCGTGSMEVVGGELRFEHEVDDARWVTLGRCGRAAQLRARRGLARTTSR